MLRYPDEVVIRKVVGNKNQPDKDPIYDEVYRGRCRVFRDGKERMKNGKPYVSDFKIIFPDAQMITIGEGFMVAMKYHNSVMDNEWDAIGRTMDFARYDRVCEVYVTETKENMIREDMPEGPEKEEEEKAIHVFENEYIRIDGSGYRGDMIIIDQEPVNIRLKDNAADMTLEFGVWDPENIDDSKKVIDDIPMEIDVLSRYTNGYLLVTNAHAVGHPFMLKITGILDGYTEFSEIFKCREEA